MKEIFRAIDDAYFLLDKCIDKLLKGRITKDEKLEQEAYCDMEYAVNGTMQNLSYLEGRLKGKTLNEWIKVEDRLPEIDEYVLCATKGGKYMINSMYIPKDCKGKVLGPKEWRGSSSVKDSITHWMPIVPPKED